MANNAQEFERTDRVLADTFNENLVGPVNQLIAEHNQLVIDVAATDQKIDDLIIISATPPAAPEANTYWYKVI